ncbi:HmuY family protein [Corallococcus sp. EGB]|uniref:HmuY family protein n=1 Tax=Corallococcus sp. EGB TaxID=1521117 RepID=UPI001CBB4AEA|nr:HmuY family protein [Corallococcus sp. EGB]
MSNPGGVVRKRGARWFGMGALAALALAAAAPGCSSDECVDAFDCRDQGAAPSGKDWSCNADKKCELRTLTPDDPDESEVDAGTQVDAGTEADAGTGTDAGTETDAGSQVCPGSTVACTEQSIDKLRLRSTVSDGGVTEEGTTQGEHLTFLDGRAGGASAPDAYTYARFTATGLQKVYIDDQAALNSTGWDVAVRRYVIRFNSGVSGPSCVTVAQTPDGTTFESVTSVPEDARFLAESYFTPDTCTYQADEFGLQSPATQTLSYWTYASCLQMTNKVYLLQLADGRHVKLQVADFYEPAVQEECDTTGKVSSTASSGSIRLRWAYLP